MLARLEGRQATAAASARGATAACAARKVASWSQHMVVPAASQTAAASCASAALHQRTQSCARIPTCWRLQRNIPRAAAQRAACPHVSIVNAGHLLRLPSDLPEHIIHQVLSSNIPVAICSRMCQSSLGPGIQCATVSSPNGIARVVAPV